MKKIIVSFVVSACIVFSLVGTERGKMGPREVLEAFYLDTFKKLTGNQLEIREKVLPVVEAISGCVRDSHLGFLWRQESLQDADTIIQQFEKAKKDMKSDLEKEAFFRFSLEFMEDLIVLLDGFSHSDDHPVFMNAPQEWLCKHVQCLCKIYAYILSYSITVPTLIRDSMPQIAVYERYAELITTLITKWEESNNMPHYLLHYASYFKVLSVITSLCTKTENSGRARWLVSASVLLSIIIRDYKPKLDFVAFLKQHFHFFRDRDFADEVERKLEEKWDSLDTKARHACFLEDLKTVLNVLCGRDLAQCNCPIASLWRDYSEKFEAKYGYRIVRYVRSAGNCVASALTRCCCSRSRRKQKAR